MRMLRIAALAAVFLSTAAISSQPVDERKAQQMLPTSHHALWEAFDRCKVDLDPKKFTYSITFTPEVKAMAGKPFTISGFILPLEPSEKFSHFLLSKRTPTCPFCPPGEPNEVVEVFTKAPMKWEDSLVTMSGTMAMTNNPDMGLFFQMKNAERVKK